MNLHLRNDLQPVPQVRALQTLLAVNAILPLPLEQMLQRIDQELHSNPALDRDTYPCAQCGHPVEGVVCARCGYSALGGAARLTSEPRSTTRGLDDPTFDPLSLVTRPESLIEHLEGALTVVARDAIELRVGRYLIGCLDSRGYCDVDLRFAATDLGVDVARVESALALLQTLDPPGIAARTLEECLSLQLRQLPASPLQALAMRIVGGHLPQVARDQLATVAAALKTSVESVRKALAFIREHCTPAPAEQFRAEHGGDALRPDEVALPDVVLTPSPEGYKIEINGADALRLKINPLYRQVLAAPDRQGQEMTPTARDDLRGHVRRARLFIETVRRRNWTLFSCVECIVKVQRAFLDHGPSQLIPLTMSDVAKALQISESTVSRALDGKFVQLPDGRIHSFTIFFDHSAPVKERIRALIAEESTDRPMTDLDLARALCADGFVVARRTVAKYRKEMRLPVWRSRRGAAAGGDARARATATSA